MAIVKVLERLLVEQAISDYSDEPPWKQHIEIPPPPSQALYRRIRFCPGVAPGG